MCLGHFEVLNSTVQPKNKFFSGEKLRRHHHVPEPDILKTRILEKAFKLQLVSDRFFPHR